MVTASEKPTHYYHCCCLCKQLSFVGGTSLRTGFSPFTDKLRSINMSKKNKTIITAAILILVGYILICTILISTKNDVLYFHYINNPFTEETFNLLTSILIYISLWGVIGLISSFCVFQVVKCLCNHLHRKDYKNYEEELRYGRIVSFVATYTLILIIMVLNISNIMTIVCK